MRHDRLRFESLQRAAFAALTLLLTTAAACGASQDAAPADPAAAPADPAAAAAPLDPAAAAAPLDPAAAAAPADPAAANGAGPASSPGASKSVTSLHQLTARTIQGVDQALAVYQGKVILAVNTASQCGYTPQYAGLEELWNKYKDKGLVVLGFPSNDFAGQEPGSDREILTFCQRYDVSFPLFSKSKVRGSDASPVYRFLAASHGQPQWNFHKYLVDKKGTVIAAFSSKVPPKDPALTSAIERALGAE